jgi:hypothetical protein
MAPVGVGVPEGISAVLGGSEREAFIADLNGVRRAREHCKRSPVSFSNKINGS